MLEAAVAAVVAAVAAAAAAVAVGVVELAAVEDSVFDALPVSVALSISSLYRPMMRDNSSFAFSNSSGSTRSRYMETQQGALT